ncbi:MAG: ribosomal protein large subunit ribosomal protein, partial [Candidatus Adlerbacteria bacterium]|nr:ribosomal protein large subunit ribosomal protein [Candidatus Adlerbacteria bacterium]
MKSAVISSPVDKEARANLKLRAGDTVRVWLKIVEKGKSRRQAFEGMILAVKHGTEPGAMFTVRKVASGVGVEKIFPLYSPAIDEVEVLRRTRVRRNKLYFIRRKAARDVARAMRKQRQVGPNVAVFEETSGADEAAPASQEEDVAA